MSLLKNWRFVLSTAVALTVVIGLAACGDDDNGGGGNGQTAAPSGAPSDLAPDAQQIFRTNVGAEPTSIDPQAQSYTYEATIVKNTYLNLFDQDPKTSELTAAGASEVPTTTNGGIGADGLTYTIKLKSGLKWSDGSPLTAQDFVYGIIRGYDLNVSGKAYGGFFTTIKGAKEALALDPASATYVQDVNNLLKDNVVAVDSQTLKVTASVKSVSFLYNFTLPITAAVQKANVEALGEKFGQQAGAAQMVTSGPFTIKEWAAKDHVTLERSDTYTAGRKAYLKTVEVKFIEDTNQAYNAFQAGQIDQVAVPPSVYPGIKSDPRVQQEPEFGTRWITVDVTLEPWNNKDFVIGINQATDRETIARDVYFGIRSPWAATCAQAVLDCDPSLFSNLEFNLDKAKASIAKAYPNGNIPTVTLETVDDPTTKALVTTLQTQWKAVGVNVDLKTTDQKTLRADMKNHVSGTQITGWGMDFADPSDLWSIKTTDSLGANNLGFWSRPEYDTMYANQDKEFDAAKRKDLLVQLQKFIAADPADITFAVQNRTNIVADKVKGIVESPFDYQVIGDQLLVDIYIAK